MRSMLVMALLTGGLMVLSCGAPNEGGPNGRARESTSRPHEAAKQLTLAVSFEPNTRPSAAGSARTIQPLIHAGLTVRDAQGARYPVLAQTVPSRDNGDW